ncbi:hypothetical protein CEUSTIGMA_g3144.t1 [Chlamydomonas eustigma]|uniref:Guanylate-binding protein N-terminal domain-containing protein n=1 Tax=Chlamydomonas eustigma TaxID=1157962 RepID=A0A250WXZ9_9CHLO|nr:hypothetical protein CEUSTIGMA_g3144.t1 [Chlamydomonas eustigma]|eukprot:GAX75701.1 hypothetical protein CEUSTIGMA_g3144.t1 [Chlamydomonas eustigma]
MGKSTLLYQLVTKLPGGAQKGFTVASTHQPCTKGLWLWSKPIPRKAADGSNMHLATNKSVELTQRLKSLESMEASSKQQLQAVQQQVERLQQEVTEKERSLVLSEAKRDALQSELGQARQKAERLEAKVAASESAAADARTQASSQRGEASRISRIATEAAERARELSSTRSQLERVVRQEAVQVVQARAEAQSKIAHMGADLSRVQTDLATSSSTGDRVHQLKQQLEERASIDGSILEVEMPPEKAEKVEKVEFELSLSKFKDCQDGGAPADDDAAGAPADDVTCDGDALCASYA